MKEDYCWHDGAWTLVKSYACDYLGGHSMYPNKQRVSLCLYPKDIRFGGLDFHIPYAAIKEIKNIDEEHIKKLRIAVLGLHS